MSDNNGNSGEKVAFSLGSKKKRKTAAPSSTVASEFGSSDHADKNKPKPERTLVIPLPKGSSKDGPLLARAKESAPVKTADDASIKANEVDDKAAQALMEAAAQHFAQKSAGGIKGETDFSAQGKMVISSESNTFENVQEKETDQFRRDVETRPEEVPVDSDVYENVRVVDFGAAMLRGMGWTGDGGTKKSNGTDMDMPRPHRLGLGATPKMPSVVKNKMRRPDQVKRDQQQEQQQREYEERRLKQIKMDKQLTLQVGSIVRCEGKRARMTQLQGVPGLNQVKVQYENEDKAVSVKKSAVNLVDREELDERPFREVPLKEKNNGKPNGDDRERNGGESRSREREKRGDSDDNRFSREKDRRGNREDRSYRDSRDKRSSRDDDRDRRDGRRERRRSRSQEREPSSRDRKRRREDTGEREGKKTRQRDLPHEEKHWLIPNIRVRIVTKKFGSRQYKQKGVVLDVTPGGSAATLEMEGRQVLEKVPERYLETALPEPGGNAIVLVGKHRFAKGKLLERDSSKGIIQVFEDMSVLTLSVDDLAQWCGPLDDDLA